MKEIVTRLNPAAKTPVVFLVDSVRDGQVDAFIGGQVKRVGISDYYQHCLPMTPEDSHEVAKMFAKHESIPEDEIKVRVRLKKRTPAEVAATPSVKARAHKTNDAALKLVEPTPAPVAAEKPAEKEAPRDLASQVQAWHDSESKKAEAKKAAAKPAEEVKPAATAANTGASATNPEGAVVERKKRQYSKKSPARQAAALRRFQEELQRTAAESPTIMEPVAHTATPVQYDAAILELAAALAKILKVPGVL